MRQIKLYIAPLLKCSFAMSHWYRFRLHHRHSYDLRDRCPLYNIYFGRYHFPDMDKAPCKTFAALGKYISCYVFIPSCKNILDLAGNRTSSCLKSRMDLGHVNSFPSVFIRRQRIWMIKMWGHPNCRLLKWPQNMFFECRFTWVFACYKFNT